MESLNNQQGFDEAFVDEPPELYQCVVCQLVLRQPILVLKCGHRFCSPCMDLFKEHSAKQGKELLCPVDRDPINLNMVCEDHGLRRAIGSLHVKCREWESGCGWVGELTELQHHHNTCQYRPPSYADVTQEVDDQTSLVRTLQERLETLEHRFNENEKEMSHFSQQIQELEEQNASLTKEVKSLKEKEAISALKLKELKQDQEEKFKSLQRKILLLDNSKSLSAELDLQNMQLDNSNNNSRSAELHIESNQVTKEESIKHRNNDDKSRSAEIHLQNMLLGNSNNNWRSAELPVQNNQFKKEESTTHQRRPLTKKVRLTQIKGKPEVRADVYGRFKSDDVDIPHTLYNWSTEVASDVGVQVGEKGFYEVCFEGGKGNGRIGWVVEAFFKSAQKNAIGDCPNSYGFNAVCQQTRHDEQSQDWGVKVNRSSGGVIGVAIDTRFGEILFGFNGNWNPPMGVAFCDIKKDVYFPAISGSGFKCFLNFGQTDFKFGPPDLSFKKVIDLCEDGNSTAL